jgi:hypothetical protein
MRLLLPIILALVLPFEAPIVAEGTANSSLEHFEKHIRPVLTDQCYKCHSADAEKVRGGLLLDTKAGVLKGGDHGPIIVPGKPAESRLINALRHTDEKLKMPPKHKLADHEVEAFVKWIVQGAPDPRDGAPVKPRRELAEAKKLWSLQPLHSPATPAVKDISWPKTPIDYFILSKLEHQQLAPVPQADRRTLIRRATFDLVGLPPNPADVESFLTDPAPLPDAFAKVIDRLLASPQYGERWGRHWLDLVRYADTAGDNSDYPVPELFRYRNYVIDSFNADKPYNQFIIEQIAGDLLPAVDQAQRNEQIIATGYIALSRRFGSIIDNYPQHLTIEDTLDNLGRNFMGLTITCARCHDHKFDAISKEDYYGLYGFFESTRYPFPGIELDKIPRDFVPLVSETDFEKAMAPHRERIAVLERKIREARDAKRSADKEKDKKRIADLDKRTNDLDAKLKQARKERPDVAFAYAVADSKPVNAKVHQRGEPKSLGPEVPRRFPDLLGGQVLPVPESTSGRLHLAKWIADPANPLTARVIVNRIWQYHFGRGLTATPSDFGVRGQPPTHPALLDWLAHRFVQDGWTFKSMHRLIMLSHTYQLSTAENPANLTADPDNKFHWRFNRRRLSAEELRDTMLFLGGSLDLSPMNQPHPFPHFAKWEYTQHHPFDDHYPTTRRSVYMLTRRITALPYLQTFDGPDPNTSTAARDSSVTTVQALYFLNNDFVHEQSRRFADMLLRERSRDRERIALALELAFARPPRESEIGQMNDFLDQARSQLKDLSPAEQSKRAWTSLAAVLYRVNEFLYLD